MLLFPKNINADFRRLKKWTGGRDITDIESAGLGKLLHILMGMKKEKSEMTTGPWLWTEASMKAEIRNIAGYGVNSEETWWI